MLLKIFVDIFKQCKQLLNNKRLQLLTILYLINLYKYIRICFARIILTNATNNV